MRFVLNDPKKADVAGLEKMKVVKGTFTQAGQFQIIIGNNVADFYNDFVKVAGVEGVSKDQVKQAAKKNQNPLQKAMSALAEIFAPLIPAIIVGGLILGFRNVIDSMQIFGGATLVSGQLCNAYSVAATEAAGWPASYTWDFGFTQVRMIGYQAQVLPAIMAAFCLAYLERFFRKITPQVISMIVVPFCSLLLAVMAAHFVLGPIGWTIGNWIAAVVQAGISGSFRVLFGAIFEFVYAPLVITGLHHMTNAVDLQLISANEGTAHPGTMLWPMIALSNIAQGSAVLGMAILQKKDSRSQEVNIPSMISCYLGVTEPAIFGVNLKYGFPFICGMIGSSLAAIFSTANSVSATAIGVGIEPESEVVCAPCAAKATVLMQDSRHAIGLMFDMVFNHTSTAHEWFQKALAGDEKYQKYYIFRDGTPDKLPTNWQSKFGGPAWEYVPSLGKWYLHLFDVTQADLNWENPEVREELKNVIRFWKKKGVKGFRFDVVNLISKPAVFEDDDKGDGRRFYTDGRHVHEFLHELVHDTGIADMVTVGEMSSTSLDNCIRYSNPKREELSMVFSFHHLKIDYKNGDKWSLMPPDLHKLKELFETWQTGMQQGGGWNAVFWENHDQPRIVSRLGDDGRYWKESAKMLGTAIHMMRGTPYVFQGEELGMTNAHFTSIDQYRDVESKNYYQILRKAGKSEKETLEILAARSRDNGRTPMQWTDGKYAGFMDETAAAAPWIPVPDYKPEANAKAEVGDPDSIFSYYQRLIRLRKELPVIASGKIRFFDQTDDKVLAYERYFKAESASANADSKEAAGSRRLIVICNLTSETVTAALPAGTAAARLLLSNYADTKLPANSQADLRPYEAIVFEAE